MSVSSKECVKIIVLGNSNVGKSSLIERYISGIYTGIRRPTVGTDFFTKKVILNDSEIMVQIWDTAGLERFHHGGLGNAFYRGAHGAIIVYDVTNENSLEQIAQWRAELHSRVGTEDFPLVVVANKIDLKRVDTSQSNSSSLSGENGHDDSSFLGCIYSIPAVVQWCQAGKYGHIEASVKDNIGVDAAVRTIALLALENLRTKKDVAAVERSPSVLVGNGNDFSRYESKKSQCC